MHAALDEKPLPAGVGVTEGGATPTAQLAAITQMASTYSALQLASMLEKLGDLAQRGRTDETMDAEGMRKALAKLAEQVLGDQYDYEAGSSSSSQLDGIQLSIGEP